MIGPVAAGSAGFGFATAGSTAESHPGSGPFDRPTANPTTPAARIRATVKRGLTNLFIARPGVWQLRRSFPLWPRARSDRQPMPETTTAPLWLLQWLRAE